MVGRKKTNQKQLGNHQKCWLWGRHAVLESLRGGRWLPLEVHVDPYALELSNQQEIEALATSQQLPVLTSTSERMTQLCGSKEHQGLMAKMPEYEYASLDSLINGLKTYPLVLILDRIQDPYNFGSILRSAEQFAVDGIVVCDKSQASVSSHVARSSSGAINYLNIAQVASLAEAVVRLQAKGLRILAASEKGSQTISAENLTIPIAIIIGNEGEGIDSELLYACDQLVTIPHVGRVDSLNAAVATGVICYEATRQRHFT